MKRPGSFLLRYLGFGLLPLWIAIAVVVGGSSHGGSDWWAVAPWYIVFSIPCCAVSLAIVALVSWAMGRSETVPAPASSEQASLPSAGGADTAVDLRRRRRIALSIAVAVALLVLWRLHVSHREAETIKLEEDEVKTFIVHNPAVVNVVPKPELALYGSRLTWNDLPFEYDVMLGSRSDLEAIVRVTYSDTHPSFVLECITALSRGLRDGRKGPCQQPLSIQAPPTP
jgi:hypothetical protein